MNDKAVMAIISANIRDFLLSHESDIANSINDFGELKLVFCYYIGRIPE